MEITIAMFVFAAAFFAIVSPGFLLDAVWGLVLVTAGLIAASLLRDILPSAAFHFDQQTLFAMVVLGGLLLRSSGWDGLPRFRSPSLAASLFSCWLMLDIIGSISLARAVSLEDYAQQGTFAYFPALALAVIVARRLTFPL